MFIIFRPMILLHYIWLLLEVTERSYWYY